MLYHININYKIGQKVMKNKVVVSYDIELVAYDAVRFGNWVLLQKLNPSCYFKSDGVIYPVREKKS